MSKRIPRPSPALFISVIALFVALGGTVYAASKIDGKTIKVRSLPGNRLKPDTVTGAQVNESSLAQVPTAKRVAAAGARPALLRQTDRARSRGNGRVDRQRLRRDGGRRLLGGHRL